MLVGACSAGDNDLAEPVIAPTTTGTVVARPEVAAATVPIEAAPVPVSVSGEPDIGVPGLDSDDVFCAAWSRWAGSYQAVLVSNAFGVGSPHDLAVVEVLAAPVATQAYDDVFGAWPVALVAEQDIVAESYLGPITRRLLIAYEALVEAGADQAAFDSIAVAWVTALSERDPASADMQIDLADEFWPIVDAAADVFADRVPLFASDTSLIIDVDTPLTDEFLESACPDRGSLTGQEIDGS